MPIYEYECKQCHHQLDLMQKMSDPPAEQCPNCMQNSLVRLVSAAGFQLKGQGWYATDFKNKNSSKPSESTSGGKAHSTSASDKQSTDKSTTTTSSTTKKTQEGDSN